MVQLQQLGAALLAASSLLGPAIAHPGQVHSAEEARRELANHHAAQDKARRSLALCSGSTAAQALRRRAVTRRAATAQKLREQRGISHKSMISKRTLTDLQKWAALSHDQSELGYDLQTPVGELFDSNSSCGLVPETTIGPYFVQGEYIRTDIVDDSGGVPMHLDLQFVDIKTCGPVPALLVDLWHCDAMGVYSGVSGQGQGGLNSTFLRGIQPTDGDGVAEFDTIFPGHYSGRAHHIHLLSNEKATVLPNKTALPGTTNHIGQIFFDQDLISAVELTEAYRDNTQRLTTNLADGIAAGIATDAHDPFVDFVLLGDSIADGLLAFITIGIDAAANYSSAYTPAAHYYEGGGVAVPGGGGGGGPGGPGGPPGGPPGEDAGEEPAGQGQA